MFLYSASYCDDDENGIRYLVFCCVILGNVEVVSPGSVQCHPSTKDFDGGVDDLQSPHHYIVWNMNVNTHIFPEYVVCFKMSLGADGGMFLLFSFPSMFNALLWRTLETILHILYTCIAVHLDFQSVCDGTQSTW